MEHPSLSVKEIKADLNLEQIQEKLSVLRSRLNFAYSIGQQEMINQLTMIIECYDRAHMEVLDEMFDADDDDDPTDNIRIS